MNKIAEILEQIEHIVIADLRKNNDLLSKFENLSEKQQNALIIALLLEISSAITSLELTQTALDTY